MAAGGDAGGSVWDDRVESDPTFCCPVGFGAGQALAGFWRDVFKGARPGARVLEIGCGSGQVSIWAAQARRGLKILATDIHNRPGAVMRHPEVGFQGGVRAEALPFPAGAFDLAVSNFGFEYAELGQAPAELARVLAPDGAAVLVMHRSDSDISVSSRLAIDIARRLTEAEVPDKVRRAAGLRRDHLSRRALLKHVLKLKAEVPAAPFNLSGAEYFGFAERLLAGEAVAAAEMDQVDQGVAMRLAMARDQSQVALDPARLRTLLERFKAAGLRAEATELSCTYPDGLVDRVGWIALLTKTPEGPSVPAP